MPCNAMYHFLFCFVLLFSWPQPVSLHMAIYTAWVSVLAITTMERPCARAPHFCPVLPGSHRLIDGKHHNINNNNTHTYTHTHAFTIGPRSSLLWRGPRWQTASSYLCSTIFSISSSAICTTPPPSLPLQQLCMVPFPLPFRNQSLRNVASHRLLHLALPACLPACLRTLPLQLRCPSPVLYASYKWRCIVPAKVVD